MEEDICYLKSLEEHYCPTHFSVLKTFRLWHILYFLKTTKISSFKTKFHLKYLAMINLRERSLNYLYNIFNYL